MVKAKDLLKHAIANTWPIYGRSKISSKAHHVLNSAKFQIDKMKQIYIRKLILSPVMNARNI